ncbi:MAG: acyl-CoA thioesterase [Planctomycetes bacterium]|nr:acyl-CoA thioesterase [Planctomycetota bacterium]
MEVDHRVIYGDTDAMGVVYYGNYMRFLELARGALMRRLGKPYGEVEKMGLVIPVAEVGVKYIRPARYDDEIVIKIRVERLTGASIRFAYQLHRKESDELLATGFTRHAVLDGKTGRVVRIPDELVQVLGGRKE